MADTKTLFPLRVADRIAQELLIAMEKACLRIDVAGGVRRMTPAVSNIDLVAIPKIETIEEPTGSPELFAGAPSTVTVEHNFLWAQLDGVIKDYRKKGDKYRSFLWPTGEGEDSIQVNLSTCDAQNWGLIYLIRTGSEYFCRHVMAALRTRSFVSKGGRVWHGFGPDLEPMSDPLPIYEEEDLFRLVKMRPVPPAERSWE